MKFRKNDIVVCIHSGHTPFSLGYVYRIGGKFYAKQHEHSVCVTRDDNGIPNGVTYDSETQFIIAPNLHQLLWS